MSDTLTRRRNFAMLPERLITDTALSDRAVRLWARLDRYAGEDGRAFPSRERLAEDLGCSVESVKRALAELVSAGWITRTPRQDGGVWDTALNDRPRRRTPGHQRPDPGSPVTRPRVTGDPQKENQEGEPPKSSAPTADADAAGDDDQLFDLDEPRPAASPVQALVGAYVEAVQSGGGVATTDMRKAIGANVGRIIRNDDIPLPVLLVAVQRAGAARAKNVDRYLGDAQRSYDRGETRRAMFARWDEIAQQIDTHGGLLAIGDGR